MSGPGDGWEHPGPEPEWREPETGAGAGWTEPETGAGADWTEPGLPLADPPAADGTYPEPYDEPRGLPDERADWPDPAGAAASVGAADPDAAGPDAADPDAADPDAGADAETAGWSGDGTDAAGWDTGDRAEVFPPALEVDVVPVDGGPWVDPDLLGADPPDPDGWTADLIPPTDPPPALLADLAAADGDPAAGWQALLGSDDPAVRALAAHWHH